MFDVATLAAFSAAVVLLALTPGPDMALIIGRGIGQGRRMAVFTALGFSLAGVVQIPLLALGVASLVSSSPVLFDVLRFVGAAYLIWKGWKMLRAAASPALWTQPAATPASALRDGMVASLLNPKSHMFLLAFLPQFVDPGQGPVALQFIILGLTMRAVALVVEMLLALFAGAIGSWLARHAWLRRWQERLTGIVMVGLGLRLLWLEGPARNSP